MFPSTRATECASGLGPLQPSSTCMKVHVKTVEDRADDEEDEGSDADADIG